MIGSALGSYGVVAGALKTKRSRFGGAVKMSRSWIVDRARLHNGPVRRAGSNGPSPSLQEASCARSGSGQFGCFLLVGATATMIHYAVLHLMVVAGLAGPVSSSTIGYVLSALFNYWANHKITFRSDQAHQVALPRFSVVALVGLALNAGLMAIGTRILGLHYLLAQLIATCMVLVFNFVASRYWTFARNRPLD